MITVTCFICYAGRVVTCFICYAGRVGVCMHVLQQYKDPNFFISGLTFTEMVKIFTGFVERWQWNHKWPLPDVRDVYNRGNGKTSWDSKRNFSLFWSRMSLVRYFLRCQWTLVYWLQLQIPTP
jgi:hypothetical protein